MHKNNVNASLDAELVSIISCLATELQGIPDIYGAYLFGSRLDSAAFTRYSDIDLIVFSQNSSYTEVWSDLSAKLRELVPGLVLHLESPARLEERSPLLVCRLISEHIVLSGTPVEEFLIFPGIRRLQAQAIFRAQEIIGTMQMHLSEHPAQTHEPLREAWLIRKFIVEMLRYHYLIQGCVETSLSYLIQRTLQDNTLTAETHQLIQELHQTASEVSPPPADPREIRTWYRLSLDFIRDLQASIIIYPNFC